MPSPAPPLSLTELHGFDPFFISVSLLWFLLAFTCPFHRLHPSLYWADSLWVRAGVMSLFVNYWNWVMGDCGDGLCFVSASQSAGRSRGVECFVGEGME